MQTSMDHGSNDIAMTTAMLMLTYDNIMFSHIHGSNSKEVPPKWDGAGNMTHHSQPILTSLLFNTRIERGALSDLQHFRSCEDFRGRGKKSCLEVLSLCSWRAQASSNRRSKAIFRSIGGRELQTILLAVLLANNFLNLRITAFLLQRSKARASQQEH